MTFRAAIHLLTEFAPVLVFFVAGQFYSFFTATLLLIVSTIISLAISLLHDGKIPFLPLVSGALVVGSGLITYVYTAPDALIFADSLYYFGLAAFIGFGLLNGKYALKWLFSATFAMEDIGWRILSWRWFIALMMAGILNEGVRIFATPEIWIDFRFVKVILIAGFGLYQFTLSKRYRIPEKSNHLGLRIK